MTSSSGGEICEARQVVAAERGEGEGARQVVPAERGEGEGEDTKTAPIKWFVCPFVLLSRPCCSQRRA
jgi:hypothetical protein